MDYEAFLAQKAHTTGLEDAAPRAVPAFLYDFQQDLVRWALQRGRAAIFADCGLGKTPMQLAWADAVAQRTGKPVLIVTPLAVSWQTVAEGRKFGIPCHQRKDGVAQFPMTVTNYEQLHKFAPSDFGGIVLDESSILKNFQGTLRTAITAFCRTLTYRLLCTATPSPNDYIELGTSAEALGELGYMDMLSRYFKHDSHTNSSRGHHSKYQRTMGNTQGWRFRGHAEGPFWEWVATWARVCRSPADLGYDGTRFQLPPLVEQQTIIKATTRGDGMLFTLPAHGLREEREEARRTLTERCAAAAQCVAHQDPAVIWCHRNGEGDLLEQMIPGAVQVSGAQSDDEKEARFQAFTNGTVRVLITKPVIGAWGLNWQHCAHVVYMVSHSFEQYYQSIRRCWRYGQPRPVTVDVLATEGQAAILANLQRKAAQATALFASIRRHVGQGPSVAAPIMPTPQEMPPWLRPLS